MVTRTQPFNRAEFRQGLQYGQAKEDFRDLSPKCTKWVLVTQMLTNFRKAMAATKENGCFKCGAPGHFKRDCPKLKNTDGGNGNAQGGVYAFGNELSEHLQAAFPIMGFHMTCSSPWGARVLFVKKTDGYIQNVHQTTLAKAEVVLCANLALHEREAKTLWSIADASLKSFMRLRRWLELLSDYDCGHSFSPARQRNADALSKPETINLKDKQMLAYASEGLPKERLELTPIEL
ncbi:putative reverse transcriptase domain-containing protein [Tanacetum coccineum]